jgi:hypothetical protein
MTSADRYTFQFHVGGELGAVTNAVRNQSTRLLLLLFVLCGACAVRVAVGSRPILGSSRRKRGDWVCGFLKAHVGTERTSILRVTY